MSLNPIPEKLRVDGIHFVLVERGTKKPFQNAWQNKTISHNDAELIEHLKKGGNYGVMGGGDNNLLIVDFDDKKIQDELLSKFPETLTVRTGSGMLHKYFFSDNSDSFKIFDEQMNTLIDVQGRGKQAIGPGSIHPNGNEYALVEDKEIAFIPYSEIKAIIMPYDKKPGKQETPIVIEKVKEFSSDNFLDSLMSAINIGQLMSYMGIDTRKNPTGCPFHASKGGKCLSFGGNGGSTAHCFHCEGNWNAISFVKQVKMLDSKEAIEFLADYAGMRTQLEESRQKFIDTKNREFLRETRPGKDELILPKVGKLISTFAEELAERIKDKNTIFYRVDTKEVVEIGEVKDKEDENVVFQGFKPIKSNRFITLIEDYVTPGIEVVDKETDTVHFKPKSVSPSVAQTILESQKLQDALPKINRIFSVPIPIIHEGKLSFPNKGYDSRFRSWLINDAPEITNTDMSLENAKVLIDELFAEFPFTTPNDKVRAIASLLTPFLRGLFPRFTVRTPVAAYKANRERAGKDYCAGITGIVYYGDALEDSPIEDDDELRKKICAGLMAGRKRFHFSNNRGHINSSTLEGVTTAENWSDRILGRSENVTIANEIDFSLSGNIGISFTPDLANRCIFINLFLALEDANSRRFLNPGLHTWLKANRGLVLSALYSLVRNWVDTGMKPGSLPFTSFPDWAKICGGIMEAAGYGNPCVPDKEMLALSVDNETKDMKVLFELGYAKCSSLPVQANSGGWITRQDIINLIRDEEVFAYYNFEAKSDLTKFGMKLSKYVGRYLSEIKLEVDNLELRGSRQRYRFVKDSESESGTLGNLGNPPTLVYGEKKNNNKYIGL